MATTGFSLTGLFQDKNFLNMLAGVGSQLGGPGSVGAALGGATLAYNKARAAQAAAKATLERNAPTALERSVIDTPALDAPAKPAIESLLDAPAIVPKLSYAVKEPSVLADEVADLLTPPDQAGPTSIARDKSGAVNMKYTPAASLLPTNEVESLLSDYLPPQTTMADLSTDYTQPRRDLRQLASLESSQTNDVLASLGPTIAQRAAAQNIPEPVAKSLDTYSTKHSVDPTLAKAIAMQESNGYHTDVDGRIKVSSKGARGTMQLMPKTAARLGVNADDEQQNLEGGVREIANLQKLSKNPKDILAGYYGGEDGMKLYQSQNATTPKGKEVLADINRYVEATYARYERMQGQTKVADLTGSTPTGIPLVDKVIDRGKQLITDLTTSGTQADRDAATARRRQRERDAEASKTAPSVLSPGTAEASTGGAPSTQSAPKSQQTQLDEILNLPVATEPPSKPVAIPIEKPSPPGPKLTQLAPKVVREQYDLRGLSPDEVDKVVGRAIEAERADIARNVDKRENTQLIETDDGYLVLNKRTREITPLTREGKVDAAKDQELRRYNKLSGFTREMSVVPGTDFAVRPRMNEGQSKSFKFGSRALQANENQYKLEGRLMDKPNGLANYTTTVTSVLESLSPETPASSLFGLPVGAVATGIGNAISGGWDWIEKQLIEVKEYVGKSDMKPEEKKRRLAELDKSLSTKTIDPQTLLGLGPAAARVQASMNLRGNLSDDEREILQNQAEFVTAVLRDESGAALTVGELLSNQRLYFPQLGDTRRDILRKMRARQTAIRGLRSSAGRPLLVPDVEEEVVLSEQ